MTSPYRYLARRRAWLPVLGPLLLAGALADRLQREQCHAQLRPRPDLPVRAARPASGSACKRQGVSLPPGRRPSAGSGQPQTRPTGSAASAFRKAMKACGGGAFPRGGNPAG